MLPDFKPMLNPQSSSETKWRLTVGSQSSGTGGNGGYERKQPQEEISQGFCVIATNCPWCH